MNNKSIGNKGEMAAVLDYQKDGYSLVIPNYTSRYGEIDIILSKNNLLVFSEVKTRNENALSFPREAVTKNKQYKIIKTAQEFLSLYPEFQENFIRFDVVEIIYSKKNIIINRFENAFE